MPFMVGPHPVMRTKAFYENGKVYLRERIKIFLIHYNTSNSQPNHAGAKQFAKWFLPQIQYKNPNVQCVSLVNMTPTPFIRCFLENEQEVLIDIDNKDKKEILYHIINVLGKPEKQVKEELRSVEKKENPSNFGYKCKNNCICMFLGQVPCPRLVPLPFHLRGKYRVKNQLNINPKFPEY